MLVVQSQEERNPKPFAVESECRYAALRGDGKDVRAVADDRSHGRAVPRPISRAVGDAIDALLHHLLVPLAFLVGVTPIRTAAETAGLSAETDGLGQPLERKTGLVRDRLYALENLLLFSPSQRTRAQVFFSLSP